MSSTEPDKKQTPSTNDNRKAEAALESVSSGIAALILQETLNAGKQIRIPSLNITLGKRDTKDDEPVPQQP